MNTTALNPAHIIDVSHAAWASFALVAAVQHEIFTELGDDAVDVKTLLEKTRLSERGLQALLDALVGSQLLEVEAGLYRNTPNGRNFLIKGKESYLGDFVLLHLESQMIIGDWLNLSEAVETGEPTDDLTEVKEHPFWEKLAPAIAPLTTFNAKQAAEDLKIADAGPCHILDIGGGSGMFALTWLRANREAEAVQIDWANVNALAKENARKMGLSERFSCRDGDFYKIDLGKNEYDFVILSTICYQQSPEDNIELFKRIKEALKPGGTLVIADFVLNNDRTGNSFALLFSCNSLLHTERGACYREADYRSWLDAGGYTKTKLVPTTIPTSLIYAIT